MKNRFLFRSRVQIYVVSADIWRSISFLNQNGIAVSRLEKIDELTYSIVLSYQDANQVSALLEPKGDRIQRMQIWGPIKGLRAVRRRPMALAAVTLLTLASIALPTRVLLIEVSGNENVPSARILEAARASGIQFGASRNKIKSEQIKNELLSQIPELRWAGVNTYGCRAVISVKEKMPVKSRENQAAGSVVAVCDGIIQSVTVTEGTAVCAAGQAVKRGQVLISEYLDTGNHIKTIPADGEIMAATSRQIHAVTPAVYGAAAVQGKKQKRFSILIGKKRINLWKGSGNWDPQCGRINKIYQLRFPGGYLLPFSFSCDIITPYRLEEQNVDIEETSACLKKDAKTYLTHQMISGEITGSRENVQCFPDRIELSADFQCLEMIGRKRLEIGAYYEQNS